MQNNTGPDNAANLREESRTESHKHGSVEFIPGNNEVPYHFKLKDFSAKGFGILVRKDSRVLKRIKTGDIISMKFHPDVASVTPENHMTQIKHISEPGQGKHEGHMVVGLMIMDNQ